MFTIELLSKSVNGTITEQEAKVLLALLEVEKRNLQEKFDNGIYEVKIMTNNSSEPLSIICNKEYGKYTSVTTDNIIESSEIISTKRLFS